jgi:hypothetical protein
MRIYKTWQQRMVPTNDPVTRLETLVHLRCRTQTDDFSRRNGDRVICQHGVDRCYREHPAGLNQEIYGFGRHVRESAEK